MFMQKFLAMHGYHAATPGATGGVGKQAKQDVAHLVEDFDEKVLDEEDTTDKDGSKFVSDEAEVVDPEDDGMPDAKPKAKEKSPVEKHQEGKKAKEPEKTEAKEPEKVEEEADEPKTLADADEVANRAKKDEEQQPKKKGIIPLERHEAILDKIRDERDEAVRALANAQGGQKIVQTNGEITALEAEVDTLQDQYDTALIDGEKDIAKGLARQLRVKERALGDKKTEIAVSIARAEAIESTRFDIARERIEQAYPMLQPGHEDYDQKKMDEVLEMTSMYQQRGYTATDAMQKAVRKECGAASVVQQEAAQVKPRVNDDDLKDKRKENAVDKAIKTQQPPSTTKVGLDSDKLGRKHTAKDVMKMSDKEFDALSDEELAKLGGDFRLVEEDQD